MYQGPGFYLHYKGSFYQALGLAVVEADLSLVVVYHPIPGSDNAKKLERFPAEYMPSFWSRPLDDFNAIVEEDETGNIHRFVWVEEDEVLAR